MSFIGDMFSAIGGLFGGGAKASPTILDMMPQMPKPAAPQQQAQAKPQQTSGGTPSFLASAALPNQGQSNAGGKSLLGQ